MNYTDEKLKDIYNAATQAFCGGIYVKSDKHPSGFDFISFDELDIAEDILDYEISYSDVSGGIYDDHDFDSMTLKEILESVWTEDNDNYAFEQGQISWCWWSVV